MTYVVGVVAQLIKFLSHKRKDLSSSHLHKKPGQVYLISHHWPGGHTRGSLHPMVSSKFNETLLHNTEVEIDVRAIFRMQVDT